jgi:hypothetical protein
MPFNPYWKNGAWNLAWSPATASECMSPVSQWPRLRTSCGSASGAALGAFSPSQKKPPPIARPSSASLPPPSARTVRSRAGAGLLCSETTISVSPLRSDGSHLQSASYRDPLDGDTVAQEEPRRDVDLTTSASVIIDSVIGYTTKKRESWKAHFYLQPSWARLQLVVV